MDKLRCTLPTPERKSLAKDLLLTRPNDDTYWAKNYYRPEDFSASLLQQRSQLDTENSSQSSFSPFSPFTPE